ncbi:MAG: DegT protein [Candidatus Gottesmanbacteria bacterium GW2011_GWA2_43_14]|uniref:DegT protein n=1 Tax=Candidatus Gottesmanbacteria bacterium GW2011_GWA2_43_14 TaxID=1618443 RepID=A0A0G1DEN0_9BACT|nr:MAG: DegT protein [Candidatus Gottesmanbacteria bacterium GW2011_GWA2_43_14]
MDLKPFKKPIYITRPILPNLQAMQDKLKQIWITKWLSNNGYQHRLFEREIQKVLKVPCVSLFNNGTIALLTAVRALNLSGEVITTPFTFPATPHVLSWNNIQPVFCDIDPVSLTIDANKIEKQINKKTTAILAVHVFGNPCNIYKIQKIASRYNLKVIYDAAHAFEVELNGIGIGNFGDLTMFSFHPTKLFHTAEGAALTGKKHELKKKVDLLKNFGIKNEEEVVEIGINGKMNEIQAALGLLVLKIKNKERMKRKLLCATYRNCLINTEGISILGEESNIKNSYQYLVIRIDQKKFGRSRNFIYSKLKEYNIFTRKYFYPLCSNFPYYKNHKSSGSKNLPEATKAVEEVLSMPFYGELKVVDIEKICTILKNLKTK